MKIGGRRWLAHESRRRRDYPLAIPHTSGGIRRSSPLPGHSGSPGRLTRGGAARVPHFCLPARRLGCVAWRAVPPGDVTVEVACGGQGSTGSIAAKAAPSATCCVSPRLRTLAQCSSPRHSSSGSFGLPFLWLGVSNSKFSGVGRGSTPENMVSTACAVSAAPRSMRWL